MDKSNPWKILSSTIEFTNPWIELHAHDITNPAGNPGKYTYVHMQKHAVAILPIDELGNVYLVGQYRFPTKRFGWEVPAGGVETGEERLLSAQRELQEETGLIANKWQMVLELELSNCLTDELATCYIASELTQGKNNPEETEQLTIKRFSPAELKELIESGEMKDALSVAVIMKAFYLGLLK